MGIERTKPSKTTVEDSYQILCTTSKKLVGSTDPLTVIEHLADFLFAEGQITDERAATLKRKSGEKEFVLEERVMELLLTWISQRVLTSIDVPTTAEDVEEEADRADEEAIVEDASGKIVTGTKKRRVAQASTKARDPEEALGRRTVATKPLLL